MRNRIVAMGYYENINVNVYDVYPVCADVYVPSIHEHDCACDIRFLVSDSRYDNDCGGYHNDYACDYDPRLYVYDYARDFQRAEVRRQLQLLEQK